MPAAADKQIRVLLADDTPDLRRLVSLALELDGRFEVTGEAADGLEAVELAAAWQPEGIVLDLAMPVMDGLQAIPQIRQRSPHTKIVVFSGFAAASMAEEALARGAHAYLEKGTELGRVVSTLAALCEGTEPKTLPAVAVVAEAGVEVAGEHGSLDELIAILTHELRTPLAVIQGFAATLRKAVDRMDRDAIEYGAEAIERHSRVLEELVEALADASALEAGKLNLRLAETDVSKLVRQTVADLRELTEPHPISVSAADEITARLDIARIRQVVTNLVLNAAKFSPAAAPIEAAALRLDDAVEISVSDCGPGIPHGRLEEVFQKFVRLDPSVEGTGLGLYISRGIARAHGGDLVAASIDGTGSRFTLRLPLGVG